MSTFVAGELVRIVGPDSFADITGPGVNILSFDGGVTFDADLTPEQVSAIWWRMTSLNADDESKRRNLADLRAAAKAADLTTADGLEALRALLVAMADYRLGDS